MLRPQSILDLMSLIAGEFAEESVDPITHATSLIEAANKGDKNATDTLLAHLTDHTEDYALYVEVLIQLDASQAGRALARDVP